MLLAEIVFLIQNSETGCPSQVHLLSNKGRMIYFFLNLNLLSPYGLYKVIWENKKKTIKMGSFFLRFQLYVRRVDNFNNEVSFFPFRKFPISKI